MIALVDQHVVNTTPLRRETKAAGVQPFAEFTAQFFLDHTHGGAK
jgi:hypothetical protein